MTIPIMVVICYKIFSKTHLQSSSLQASPARLTALPRGTATTAGN